MAEHTVDQLCRHLGRRELKCSTAETPLLQSTDRRFSMVVPPAITREALAHFVTSEWALTLEDVMVRRSSWQFYHRDAAKLAEQVATWMAELVPNQVGISA